jgi:hypothetical protein
MKLIYKSPSEGVTYKRGSQWTKQSATRCDVGNSNDFALEF